MAVMVVTAVRSQVRVVLVVWPVLVVTVVLVVLVLVVRTRSRLVLLVK